MSPERSQTEGSEEVSKGSELVSGGSEAMPVSATSTSDADDAASAILPELLPGVDSGEDNNDDPAIVTPSSPVTALPASLSPTEDPVTVTTVCGYALRKRSVQQLEAMRPVKRTRRSVISTEVEEIDCIDNRRTVATGLVYRVTWIDDSDPIWLPRDQLIEESNANLVETLDAYLLRYPNCELPYQTYIS
ncbi:hypothetical protein Plhal703r1_c95g0174731 [Plasmopara halstedii]